MTKRETTLLGVALLFALCALFLGVHDYAQHAAYAQWHDAFKAHYACMRSTGTMCMSKGMPAE